MDRRAIGLLVVAALAVVGAVAPTSASAHPHLCHLLMLCPPDPEGPPPPDPGGQESPDQPVPVLGKSFGFNGLLFVSGAAATAEDELDRAKLAGANVYRYPVAWEWLQQSPEDPPLPNDPPPGSYADRLNTFYVKAIERNITPIFTTAWAPDWATKYSSCPWLDLGCGQIKDSSHALVPDRAHLDEYGTFVEAVKRRWPRALIEPWNEPNIHWGDPQYQGSRDFSASPEHFKDIQCAAYQGSKNVNADAVLAAGWWFNNYREYVGRVYAAGGKDCWDQANLHFYPGRYTNFGEGSGLGAVLKQVRDLRTQYGDRDPLWITETGYTTASHGEDTVSIATQCEASRRLYNRLITMSDVTGVLFHTLRDKPHPDSEQTDREHGFGFLWEAWSPKPVYRHFQRQAGNGGSACPT